MKTPSRVREKDIVQAIASELRSLGYQVAEEVANFHRSADIAAIDTDGSIWVVECKLSAIGRALRQIRTHKLAADKVFLGTGARKLNYSTRVRLREEGVGVIMVHSGGEVEITAVDHARGSPWAPARNRLLSRIKGRD